MLSIKRTSGLGALDKETALLGGIDDLILPALEHLIRGSERQA
jgi:hypothetical protein